MSQLTDDSTSFVSCLSEERLWEIVRAYRGPELRSVSEGTAEVEIACHGRYIVAVSSARFAVYPLSLERPERIFTLGEDYEPWTVAFSSLGLMALSFRRGVTQLRRIFPEGEFGGVCQAWPFFARMIFSPDGEKLIGVSNQGLEVWDVESGRLSHRYLHHDCDDARLSVATGAPLAVSYEGNIALYDLRSSDCTEQIRTTGLNILGISYHPDGLSLASGVYEQILQAWDRRKLFRSVWEERYDRPVFDVLYSSTGELATAIGGGYLDLWVDQRRKKRIETSDSPLFLAFGKESDRIYVGSDRGKVRLYDLSGPSYECLSPRQKYQVDYEFDPRLNADDDLPDLDVIEGDVFPDTNQNSSVRAEDQSSQIRGDVNVVRWASNYLQNPAQLQQVIGRAQRYRSHLSPSSRKPRI